MIVIRKLRIHITIDKVLAILLVLRFLYLKGNAIAKYLSPAAKTSETKETKSDIFLKRKVVKKNHTLLYKDDGCRNNRKQSKFFTLSSL